ncbi:hypothetical protein NQ318_011433, partial [Aromia moschata]
EWSCNAMLERTTRSYLEDILSKDITYLDGRELIALDDKRTLRRTSRNGSRSGSRTRDDACLASEERNMTRKTRTRRPRIPAIQSGYCAVCSLPYNSVEDHIQSKKHLKLIGEDANYIALNGSLNGFLHTNSIPFLNLNGIDAIGVHETSLDEFSPKYKRKNMPRTRAASVVCDRVVKPSPLSPTGSDVTGHHLRSRRNINYMTPPLDDDSLQERPDIILPEKRDVEPAHREYKEYRELRSSTRALAKLTEQISDHQEEVWNSGRPKRACIKQKRTSANEALVVDKTAHGKDDAKKNRSQSPRRDEKEDKGLIVKFKKLRNSELIQLNNEATNFLFPKKEEDSTDDEDIDVDGPDTTVSSIEKDESTLLSSDAEDTVKSPHKFKIEDEASMDSTCSEGKRKRRRRTHAEAFIMDNQKYYKFETPGSRLRYQGTYLSSGMRSPKHNGECTIKTERTESTEEPLEKMVKINRDAKVIIDNYKFSFEKIPTNAPWYEAFQRLDKGEQRYFAFSDKNFWDPFILPYQMPSMTPLDPKVCARHYNELLKCICNTPSETDSTGCSTPEHSTASTPSLYEPDLDEDSKMSAATVSSTCSLDEVRVVARKRRGRGSGPQGSGGGKNPRKSPRQHASTLAILSSFIHQRKRRSKNRMLDESLPAIPEEENAQQSPQEVTQEKRQLQPIRRKPKSPQRRFKPKIDYISMARQIDDHLDMALDDNLEDLDIGGENTVDFCRRGREELQEVLLRDARPQAGQEAEKNKTGWPNKNRRLVRKGQDKEKEDENDNDNDDSTIDSVSVNLDSDDDESNSTDSIKKVNSGGEIKQSEEVPGDANRDSADKSPNDKVLTNKVTNGADLQPYVCVQKLDSDKLLGRHCRGGALRKAGRRLRRPAGSPKSPRTLRRPRGRWYRER